MPGEQPKDTNVVVPSGVVAGSSSNGQEDVGRNAAGQATAGPSTKPKKKRKTKRIPGPVKKPRPFKHVKILTDRCIKVRRFLGRQKSFTGLTIPNILSQALTRREVSLEWNYLVDLYRDAWPIFFPTGLLGSGSRTYARARPCLVLLVTYYEHSHILMNGKARVDLSLIRG